MAPTFRHGKGTRVLMNQFDLSPFFKNVKKSDTVQASDVTTFQQNDMNYIPGLRDAKIMMDGLFNFSTGAGSTSIDRILANYLGGSTQFVTTIAVEPTTGGWALMMKGDQLTHDVESPVSGVVVAAAQVQGSSFHFGGVMLRPLKAAVATTANTAVVYAGTTGAGSGSTNGGVAHLHVTAASTVTTGYTIKVQHSTSGSTWVDLVSLATLTTADGGTFVRSTVAGTIKEQLRSNLSAFTGGAAKSITFAVAFSRNGKAKG